MVVMQSEVGATVSASRDRLIGTAIGAVAGALFGMLGSNVLWFGLASTLTILSCHVLGLEQSYLLARVTVAIIMLVWAPEPPLEYGDPSLFWKLSSELGGLFLLLGRGGLPVGRLPPDILYRGKNTTFYNTSLSRLRFYSVSCYLWCST
jgi:hypothetical protein